MDDARTGKGSGRGGRREGAGKPLGAITGTTMSDQSMPKHDKVATGRLREKLEISPEFADASPLQIMLAAMRHFATKGEWMVAAGVAEKAAKYLHAPKAARSNAITDEFSHLSEDDLAQLAGNDLAPPKKKAA